MEKKPPDQKISIRFPQKVLEDIRALAQEEERSFNGEIIWILRNYVARKRHSHGWEQPKKLVDDD